MVNLISYIKTKAMRLRKAMKILGISSAICMGLALIVCAIGNIIPYDFYTFRPYRIATYSFLAASLILFEAVMILFMIDVNRDNKKRDNRSQPI